ncbi:hypothetical protein CTKA_02114 [Chthonomonas calidirosea]|uniref:Uncharacterized protein conserved in bacteria n=1 Tax=Chthonomonas calidirosea (strain DSM 23976 / ICMP 18418 / T49) TaxID=1303518 RepID=S0EVH5_CHTCT|nr:glycosyltransferase [Chthonomonas calidirosea]CCW35788.1 Uncharacterized protein conserved in bacteria [Chthonomonas calidirosea T49]CEK19239.1 hypothetical protein CTKA_02114 [Chthonomonas calidirosea]
MRVLIGFSNAIPELAQKRPLPGRERAGDEILCLQKEGGDICYTPGMTWQQVLDACPKGWHPDIYVHRSPEYHPLPAGLEHANCFTVGVFGDWNLGGYAIRSVAEVFDWLVADLGGCQILRDMGFSNVEHALLWGYNPQQHRLLPGYENDAHRDIEVLFIGSFHPYIHSRRTQMLARVARLSTKYRVLLASGIYGQAYTQLMNRAKIVFNHSVRGECNMRAYEAAACGALLFNEADNLEIGLVFRDGEECVLYTEDNLEERIAFYLAPENTEERLRIAAAAHARVQQHTDAHHLAKLLDKLEFLYQQWRLTDRKSRLFRHRPTSQRQHRLLIHWLRMPTLDGLSCVQQSLAKEGSHPSSLFLRGFAAAELALQTPDSPASTVHLLEAKQLLERQLVQNPQDLAALYSLSRVERALGQEESAWHRLHVLHARLQAGERPLAWPLFPHHYEVLDIRLESLWLQYSPESPEGLEGARKTLLGHTAAQLSTYHFERGEFSLAANYAQEAIAYLPEDGWMHTLFARAQRALGNWQRSLPAYRKALEYHPFLFEAVEEAAKLLMDIGRKEEAITLLNERLPLFEAASGTETLCDTLRSLLQKAQQMPPPSAPSELFYFLAIPSWSQESDWKCLVNAFWQHASRQAQARLLLWFNPQGDGDKTVVTALRQYLQQLAPEASSKVFLIAQPLALEERWKLVRSVKALLRGGDAAPFWEELANAVNLPIYSLEDLREARFATNISMEKRTCL